MSPVQDRESHVHGQRRFYETGAHHHLRPRQDDFYASKAAAVLARGLGVGPGDRVLEVGAGFGRFTFHLLDHCREVVALDLSPRALDDLSAGARAAGVADGRLRTVEGDIDRLDPAELAAPFDFVVGFFILHHLPDYAASVARLTQVLAAGGRMAFLEPNRRNPLFLAQVACCPDMSWREEKGMFSLSARGVEDAFTRAGLRSRPTHRFGFLPPPVLQGWPATRSLEERLEQLPGLNWLLPLLLLSAEAPG